MAYFASQPIVLDKFFQSNSESAAWLASEQFPTLTQIPEKLHLYQGMGCKKIDWKGQKVGLICFRNEGNDIVHLFVIDRTAIAAGPNPKAAFEETAVYHDRETKGWVEDDKTSPPCRFRTGN